MKNKHFFGDFLAVLTVFIWGITFVSTKILLNYFSPEEILIYRFIIAFLVLNLICPERIKFISLKEESIFATLGLTGIALYFGIENIALKYTYASNVGLISSSIPIFTALLSHYITKEKNFSVKFLIGFALALGGIAIIIFNGKFLKLNPIGDFLALLTAIFFATYSTVLRLLKVNYSQMFITKKIFFYGVLFMLPLIFMENFSFPHIEELNISTVGNLLFLSIFASILCFIMWNKSVALIGAIKATNYLYFVPLVTIIASSLVLKEKINTVMIFGGILICLGVYINNKVR